MMNEILSHTPIWVWLVLAYGLWMGIQAFQVRRVTLLMATLLPLVFLGLSLSGLIGVIGQAPAVGLAWLLTALAGVALGWFFLSAEPLEIERGKGRLVVPGTWTVLVFFLVIFLTKFVYGVEQATNSALASSLAFQAVVFALSGLSTGIVTGRTARLYNRYFQATA